jgi:hypothetical protein
VTSGRRDRSSPSLSTLCDHPRHCRTTAGTVTTSRHCWGARGQDVATTATMPRTAPRQRHPRIGPLRWADDQLLCLHPRGRFCTSTRRNTTPRLGRIRQDNCQLRGTRHASTHREIVQHACKLLPPWPIKGGAVPQPQGQRDDGQRSPTRSPPSPRYWHSPQSIPLGLGGQASSPTMLVAPLYEHRGAKQYSALSTPLLDVRPRPEPG